MGVKSPVSKRLASPAPGKPLRDYLDLRRHPWDYCRYPLDPDELLCDQ